jgi:epoxyqueuosine reductase QueG
MICDPLSPHIYTAAEQGEFGKHGSTISRKFGAGVRLAGVTTDMPLRFQPRVDGNAVAVLL